MWHHIWTLPKRIMQWVMKNNGQWVGWRLCELNWFNFKFPSGWKSLGQHFAGNRSNLSQPMNFSFGIEIIQFDPSQKCSMRCPENEHSFNFFRNSISRKKLKHFSFHMFRILFRPCLKSRIMTDQFMKASMSAQNYNLRTEHV